MKLLLTGDLHIGRSSSRVPPDAISADELRTASAWQRIVAMAIRERVAVVILSGDVADQDNKFWEAIGPLERGVTQLAEAKIRTVAVAGNHDFDVLVKLADQLPPDDFTLLGRGGTWERLTITEHGQSLLHIDGWSFPNERVHESPLDSYDFLADASTPTLGLVHGDLDAPNSPYAPLDLSLLQSLPANAWLLGHIHAPRLIDGPTWVLYPGSPQAMDPGEPGMHGPWMVDVKNGSLGKPRQVAMSTVWYDRHTINLSEADTEDAVYSTIFNSIRENAAAFTETANSDLAHISLRLRLEGQTAMAHRVAEIVEPMKADLSLNAGHASVAIESIDVQVTPRIDLADFTGTNTAPGAVARLLLDLDNAEPSAQVQQLVREAHSELERIATTKEFTQLENFEITADLAREHLRTQGRQLLTKLVNQQP